MDLILLYSQHSDFCMKLADEFPNIMDRAVSVDSSQSREIADHLSVSVVPTLLVVAQDKIIQRVIGYYEIRNWLGLTSLQVDNAVRDEEPPPQQMGPERPTETSIDDLLPPSSHDMELPREAEMARTKPASLREAADAMKREREIAEPPRRDGRNN